MKTTYLKMKTIYRPHLMSKHEKAIVDFHREYLNDYMTTATMASDKFPGLTIDKDQALINNLINTSIQIQESYTF